MRHYLLLPLISILAASPTQISAQEAYATLSSDHKTLTFYYDNEKSNRNGMAIGPFDKKEQREWNDYIEDIITAVFDKSFSEAGNITSTAYWFKKCVNLTDIAGLEYLRTDNVTNMNSMFDGCNSITSLDLRTFNTGKVENMMSMFSGCHSLVSIDVSSFNTSNVISMLCMFEDCSMLPALDLSNFNTEKVTSMLAMFEWCEALTDLNLRNFNTANVTDMSGMFSGCTSLATIDLGNFDTSKVTNMKTMFRDCRSLTNLNIKSFDTSSVENMSEMFNRCKSIKTLDLSSFNTANVTSMYKMFGDRNEGSGCGMLTTIYVSDEWATVNVESGEEMFGGCQNLVGGNGTVWDENHIHYDYAHVDGGPGNPGYLTYKENVSTSIETFKVTVGTSKGIYDMNGLKLQETPSKGLYVRNGKKYIAR